MNSNDCEIVAIVTIDEPFGIELKTRARVPEGASHKQIVSLAERALQTAQTRLDWQLDLRLEIPRKGDEPLVIAELCFTDIPDDTATFQKISTQAVEMIWDNNPKKVAANCCRDCLKSFTNLMKKYTA